MFDNIRKILFLGPKGSYTELAMNFFMEHFGFNVEIEAVSTIKKIIQEVDKNSSYMAVVPVENTIEGIVRETVDALLTTDDNTNILAQTVLPISHCLISKGKFEDIKTIISHPQALSQCQGYIVKNFGKNVNLISANSTSFATASLKELDNSYASIGNELCAKMYGFEILDKNINDVNDNRTRFALIGQKGYLNGANRTSIAFSTKNEPGALLKVLEVFKKYNLNLIYLESRPSKEVIGDYVFFADIDRGFDSLNEALAEINDLCSFCKILGSYSVIKYENVM